MPQTTCQSLAFAKDENLFSKHGMDAQLTRFKSRTEATKALTAEPFDLICLNLAELLTLPDLQHTYKIILIPAYSEGADVLIARKDAGADLNDLKGARIGIPPASMGENLLTRALTEHTLAREDFTVLPEEAEDLQDALTKSEIQLAVAAPPYSLEILKNPDMAVMFRSTDMPFAIFDVIALHKDRYTRSPRVLSHVESLWDELLPAMKDRGALPEDYRYLTRDEQRDFMQSASGLAPTLDALQRILQQAGTLKTPRDHSHFMLIPTER